MSAYTDSRPNQVISLARGEASAADPLQSSLDAFLGATRQIEASLRAEREVTRRLKDDLKESRDALERTTKDADSRIRELIAQESRYRAALTEFQSNERKLVERVQTLSREGEEIKAELGRYKAAWAGVLQREREAKMILQESEGYRRKAYEADERIRTLESKATNESQRREQAERHSQSYQSELQSVLVRLHSAESRFNELSRELKATQQSKKALGDEVARIELSMRERFEWEAIREREKLKAELEKTAALDREKFRESFRQTLDERIKHEVNRSVAAEREEFAKAREQLEFELSSLRLSLDYSKQQLERAGADAEAKRNHAVTANKELKQALEAATAELERIKSEHAQEAERARLAASLAENTKLKVDQQSFEIQVQMGELQKAKDKLSAERSRAEELEREIRRMSMLPPPPAPKPVEAPKPEIKVAAEPTLTLPPAPPAELKAIREQLLERSARTEWEARVRKLEDELRAERKRTEQARAEGAESVSKKERARNTRLLEQAKGTHELKRALKRAKHDLARLKAEVDAEADKGKTLQSALINEKERFETALAILEAELTHIRAAGAFRELIKERKARIRQARAELNHLATGSDEGKAARQSLEVELGMLLVGQSELQELFDTQMSRIQGARDSNTVLAEPVDLIQSSPG